MTSSLLNTSSARRRLAGFTLVELMIAATLSSIILAGVLSSFLMLVKSGVRISNYSTMEAETRRAFEQLGIDARMSNDFDSAIVSGEIVSFTLTIPTEDAANPHRQVTYGFEADPTDSTKKRLFLVPGDSASATAGKRVLISKINAVVFARYNSSDVLIPTSTVLDTGVKHIQVQVSVSRSAIGVAAATQVIRSSAFTIRNISI